MGPEEEEREEERRRKRLYNNAALARSLAPHGLGALHKLSSDQNARAREEWRALSVRDRLFLSGLMVFYVGCGGLLVWGITEERAALIFVAVGLFGASFLVAIVAELRRSRRARGNDPG